VFSCSVKIGLNNSSGIIYLHNIEMRSETLMNYVLPFCERQDETKSFERAPASLYAL
jgi:hypothetical protein